MFGAGDLAAAALDPDLQGMDIAHLRLEAEFSHSKRIGRIRETFARTASMYGSRFTGVLREFAVACPPRTYERYPDARDFFDWLEVRCAGDPSVPAWTADVARIEIALARARTFRPSEAEADALARPPNDASSVWYPPRPPPRNARLTSPATPGDRGARSRGVRPARAFTRMVAARARNGLPGGHFDQGTRHGPVGAGPHAHVRQWTRRGPWLRRALRRPG